MSRATRAVDPAELRRRLDRPVVLVGMMGTGKSTVGRKLAQTMTVEFTDADHEIEQAAQMSVGDIFTEFGEAYFRDGERRVIARLLEESSGVIATGGGAFCNEETRALILDRAIAVWLDSPIDVLVERTGRKDTRPLLRDGDPQEILTRLHAERAPFYGEAQLRVESANGPHQQTVERILSALDDWTRANV
ncbi:shikimate kinase [Alteriqipengyuania sp. WL0013]|uniref:shikimate kinase n=1 Tax=Alteriqipengyuania sp. WL0013 TaxID=3110773 RepID=UPI002C49E5EF|nr:shikimate kinase [Alteriqipengyuania sp. WL0013]MEB3415226.1 shikimate kinase [Alteriqipengyuania sp. WL0013]